MYGLVNKGIRDMVIKNHGEITWEKIRKEANCEEDFFASMQIYDDSLTYNLVGAATKILGASAHNILVGFGEFWVTFTAKEGYGDLLRMAGNTFPEFLSNLDNLHVRVGTTYNDLKPPSFTCQNIDESTLILQYRSHREGLSSLVIGLLNGLGKIFEVSVEIDQLKKREAFGFDEYLIKYQPISNSKPKLISKTKQTSNNGEQKCPFGHSSGIK